MADPQSGAPKQLDGYLSADDVGDACPKCGASPLDPSALLKAAIEKLAAGATALKDAFDRWHKIEPIDPKNKFKNLQAWDRKFGQAKEDTLKKADDWVGENIASKTPAGGEKRFQLIGNAMKEGGDNIRNSPGGKLFGGLAAGAALHGVNEPLPPRQAGGTPVGRGGLQGIVEKGQEGQPLPGTRKVDMTDHPAPPKAGAGSTSQSAPAAGKSGRGRPNAYKKLSPQAAKKIVDDSKLNPIEVKISRSKYPEVADHIEDAIKNGNQPATLTLDRAGANANRAASLKNVPRFGRALQRDEYPPAMFKEGGQHASVRILNGRQNGGAGSTTGWQLDGVPDGATVRFVIVP
jgi:hypothetical protein